MEVELRVKRPLSGDCEEHNFAETNDIICIKFTDTKWNNWYGIFDKGFEKQSLAYSLVAEPYCWILVGGKLFFFNVDRRNFTKQHNWFDIENIIYNSDCDAIVVTDGLRIGIVEKDKLVWCTKRISTDGIDFNSSSGSIVKGKLNDMTTDWTQFEFNILTKKVSAPWLFYRNIS